MSARGLFVTGTDTGVGKTLISSAVVAGAGARGLRVAGMKPIASGCEESGQGLRNSDALALQAVANVALRYEQINPYAFAPAIAPHLAAREAGVAIDFMRLEQAYADIAAQADLVVVEGAGGWRVPLDEAASFADIPLRLGLQVLLVVGIRLGCLNHALLSAEAIARDGAFLSGWVASCIDPDDRLIDAQVATLRERIDAPLRGVVPALAQPSAAAALAFVDIDALLLGLH